VNGQWFRLGDWARATPGRSWEFVLSTAGIIQVLGRVADRRQDAFTLLQCDRVPEGQAWRSIYRELPLDGLTLDGSWQYLIRSRTLYPAIPPAEARQGAGWPGEFALNGLILLHHPDPGYRSEPPASRIGIVNRIANQHNGHIHDHSESDTLFATLKRALQPASARA
jgi:hypothetical protein